MIDKNPLCVSCGVRFKPEKNGVYVKVIKSNGMLYYVAQGDKWKCPKCGFEIITGYGSDAILCDYQMVQQDNINIFQRIEDEGTIIIDRTGVENGK